MGGVKRGETEWEGSRGVRGVKRGETKWEGQGC